MAVKYVCTKCNRRFVDWAAKKMDYKCPHDESCPPGTDDETITLIRVGASLEDGAVAKPTLKRKKAASSAIVQESSLLVDDDFEVVEEIDDVEDVEDEEPEVLKGGRDIITEVVIDEEEVVSDDEAELNFEEAGADVVVEEFGDLDEEV